MDEPLDLDNLMMNEKRVRVEGFVTQPVSWKEKLIGSVPIEVNAKKEFGILSGSLGDIDGIKSTILNGREENKEFGEEIVENGESNKGNIKAEAKINVAINRKRVVKCKSLKKVVVEDAITVGSDTVMVESNDETLGDGHTYFRNFLSEYKKDLKLDLVALFKIRINGSKVDSVVTKLGFENFFRVEVMGFTEDLWLLWNDDVGIDILKVHSQLIHMRIRVNGDFNAILSCEERRGGAEAQNMGCNCFRLKSDNRQILVSANMTKEIEGRGLFVS
ncbi:hypothetical protein Goshw_014701 [Gossypium schwendimanii]|uniref:DUF4283 domain-containing protein n=1 Tax=Gossypium schwendimanii TaxID=34291 RepID=A0A7J9KSE7_GOSSC|nr:hypothetical protein [Gossypium schwendimanii]